MKEEERAAGDKGHGRLALAVLVACSLLAGVILLNRLVAPEWIFGHYESLRSAVDRNFLRSLLLFGLGYALAVSFSLPGATLLTVLGGLLFGSVWGGAMAVLAATAGAVMIFLLARTALRPVLSRFAGHRIDAISAALARDVFGVMLFLRLTPVFPFWLVNLAPALLGVRLRTFSITTLIGIVPATFAFAAAGAGLGSVVDAQARAYSACLATAAGDCRFDLSLHSLVTPRLLWGLTALGVAALLPVLLRRSGLLRSAISPDDPS